MKRISLLLIVFFTLTATQQSYAQFTFNGQILNRSEYKHGYGTLIDTSTSAAFSIGQRSRLNANYTADKVKFGMAVQDVRTWGNTSQIKITDGLFSLHEAWTEILFNPKFSAKIGRQELDYDDARFLGNLDWALQARAHDIALLKYIDTTHQIQIHAGFAFNQTGDFLSGTYYNQPNQYKIAQMLWLNKKWQKFTIGFLFWNNGLQTDTTITHKEKVNYTSTLALPIVQYKVKDITLKGFFYYQFGHDAKDKEVAAYNSCLDINYTKQLNKNKKSKISLSSGIEYISGTSQTDTTNTKNQSFTPFYGTNHRHNGYMDYFYVGGRHLNTVGLIDGYLNTKYDFNTQTFVGLSIHYFSAAAPIRNTNLQGFQKAASYLGTEFDITIGHQLTEAISFQAGYSQMFAGNSLKLLRNSNNSSSNQDWAYLAILFRPNLKNKFTGLKW